MPIKINQPEIIFVGTASGKTSAKRNHSSILLKTVDHNLLIDAGDGICKALLTAGIDFNEIDSVLFTHYHADHFSGIASLVTQMKLTGRQKRLNLFTHSNLLLNLESLLNSVYMFKETLGFHIEFTGFEFDSVKIVNDKIKFTAAKNSHIIKKEDLSKYPDSLFQSSSVLFSVGDKKIIYTSDIGSKKDFYLFENEHCDYFITEAAHVNIDDLLELLKKLSFQKLFVTHYGDENEIELKKFVENFSGDPLNKVTICHDGLKFHL
jgi:ribonuclease Z